MRGKKLSGKENYFLKKLTAIISLGVYLQQRVSVLQKPACDSVARLVVSHGGFLGRLKNPRLLYQTSDHPLYSLLKMFGGHGRAEVPRRNQSCFVTDVCNISP